MPDWEIIVVQILPNALPPVIVVSTLMVATAILTESGLSFLGLGDPNHVSWGYMIGVARTVLRTAWWMAAIPGLMILVDGDRHQPRRRGPERRAQPEAEAAMSAVLAGAKACRVHFRTRRGVVRAVEDLSFDIGAGETVAIVGESGSGKSTVALALLRLIPDPPGAIAAGEHPVRGPRHPARWPTREMRAVRGGSIAMIFQDPMMALNPVHTHRAPDRRGAASCTSS